MNWMNLPEEYCRTQSKFVILPLAYEKNLTYGEGASQGPSAIINASQHLEYYDEQYDNEPFQEGITLSDMEPLSEQSPEDMIKLIQKKIVALKKERKDAFIIGLGGDHAVTAGIVAGFDTVNDTPFGIVQFDAHSDFRESWNNSRYNHACVAKRIAEKHPLLLVGVRSQDSDEAAELKERQDVGVIKAYDFDISTFKEQLKHLPQKIYLTIDVDVFDPSFIKNTGTPEPGGLGWYDVLRCLEILFQEKDIIGADITEFSPHEHYEAEAYSLARLAYKIMSLATISQKI